jgi:carbamoyl-phosphate synthase small subunit
LLDWILREKKFLLHNVDTRLLTVYLRSEGSQRGIVFERGSMTDTEAKTALDKSVPPMENLELLSEVSCPKSHPFEDTKIYWPQFDSKKLQKTPRIALLDYGVKTNTPRILARLGCEVIVLPANSTSESILEAGRDGVFLSYGPGDPEAATQVVKELKKVLGKKPVFGICMGHQLLALALGAKTYKLKFGHRGIHHPVVQLENGKSTGRTLITSQNHGFAVDEDSLPKSAEVTFRHANDGSNEGIRDKALRCASVQFHPEAAPGPFDTLFFFEDFLKEVCEGNKT